MKRLTVFLFAICFGCHTAKITNEKYRVSDSVTELGSIGIANTGLNFENSFATRAFPKLENPVRLDVKTLPFNKDINDIYLSKVNTRQEEPKIKYVDSLPNKPVYVSLSILDVHSYVKELNSEYNKETVTLLKNTAHASVINGLAILLPEESLNKLKEADAYYLINNLDNKYSVALYKNGNRLDIIDLKQGTTLAYNLGKFCWTENDRHQWYIGDIVNDNTNCLGNTSEKIKKKEDVNLFKM
ncbi:hypothetical protein [Flavobacterium beibuense]|uniref:Putative lipoprotein n=1 Tax=Flavobacterium beibuense TaxID=657326 RepID=A0A444W8H1_9FLAO|nr:hypothetical protein [Flavobacterium beibuense]RYJ42042.1 putative lipoprotein [Flavobacterium beibuense]